MRKLFTAEQRGLTRAAMRWGERTGKWQRAAKGLYAEGPEALSRLDLARAAVLASDSVAAGRLAGVLHRLDGVTLGPLSGRARWRRDVPPERIVVIAGIRCTDGVQTLVDLAAEVDDLVWEQALESALRRRIATVGALEAADHRRGAARIRRVLALRPAGAPPTGSLLETLMVQLIRTVPGLPTPTRQVEIPEGHARVDLAWPELGVFIELDGQHHLGQPEYDARRETAVVAATGWMACRFTWREVVHIPATTRRRLAAVADQARRRPPAA